MSALQAALKASGVGAGGAGGAGGKALLLDGGMGHLLRRKGVEVKGEIGSVERFLGVGLANVEKPELVHEAHEDFLKAGAKIVTTNSYACIPAIVGDRAVEVIQAAGRIARKAADGHGGLVAGCLPPLHESYRADRVGDEEELERDYKIIAETVAPFADVLLCETMSCVREAAAAAKAAAATGKPVWVSWALAEGIDGTLISGESLEAAVAALELREGGPIQACLFNCSQPESTSAALPKLRALLPAGVLCGAYANGFRTVKGPGSGTSEYREDLSPEAYAAFAASWIADGAGLVGGCCGIFPEHLAAVAKVCGGETAAL